MMAIEPLPETNSAPVDDSLDPEVNRLSCYGDGRSRFMRPSENLCCAIYTRKSTERGLDANVTSLTAQRDLCQSYIKCQAHQRWVELPQSYDDGGYSGGTLERPALRRLIADIEEGRVDAIIIYKIDRLTRSLLDFCSARRNSRAL